MFCSPHNPALPPPDTESVLASPRTLRSRGLCFFSCCCSSSVPRGEPTCALPCPALIISPLPPPAAAAAATPAAGPATAPPRAEPLPPTAPPLSPVDELTVKLTNLDPASSTFAASAREPDRLPERRLPLSSKPLMLLMLLMLLRPIISPFVPNLRPEWSKALFGSCVEYINQQPSTKTRDVYQRAAYLVKVPPHPLAQVIIVKAAPRSSRRPTSAHRKFPLRSSENCELMHNIKTPYQCAVTDAAPCSPPWHWQRSRRSGAIWKLLRVRPDAPLRRLASAT
jgi:hypothetical protein